MNEIPRTVTGRVTISWSDAAPSPPYTVTVSPLAVLDNLDDPLNSDYTFIPGGPGTSVGVGSSSITLSSHTGQVLAANGRGDWPLALHKLPQNTTSTIEIDCSGAAAPTDTTGNGGATAGWACGGAVYDGGSNATVLVIGLVSRAGVLGVEAFAPGFAPAAVQRNGLVLASAAKQGDAVTAWTKGTIFVSMRRGYSPAKWIFTVAASGAPLANTVTLTVLDSALPALPWGKDDDYWIGATVGGFGGSLTATPYGAATATATVNSWAHVTDVPLTAPRTLLGGVDSCATIGPVTTVTVTTNTLSVYITGLSGTFPYTVTVTPFGGSPVGPTGVNALPGIWFYARHMPPRGWKLGFWADSRVFGSFGCVVVVCSYFGVRAIHPQY